MSRQMLEWMADHDDAAIVAAGILETPRYANRIFRKPPGQHGKLLTELAQKLKEKASKAPSGEPSSEPGNEPAGDREPATVTPLRGKQPQNTADPLKAKDYQSFEASRRAADRAKHA